MQCIKPVRLMNNKLHVKYPDGLLVPCGKCIACRIAKKKEWSLRLLHELDSWDNDGLFVTLTYNDEFLPENNSLCKTELQKFFKRLRKNINKPLKYFACGEYGDDIRWTNRPHYHGIIFGLTKKDKHDIKLCWPFGFTYFGTVTPDSINYVCKYIQKQYTGELAEQEYTLKNREPVFRIMSHGLGEKFCLKNSEQLIQNENIKMFGKPMPFPRYYIKKLGLENSEFRKEIAKECDIKMTAHLTGLYKSSDDYYRYSKASDIRRFERAKRKQYDQKEKILQAHIDNKRS